MAIEIPKEVQYNFSGTIDSKDLIRQLSEELIKITNAFNGLYSAIDKLQQESE